MHNSSDEPMEMLLTPDWNGIFRHMLAEARTQASTNRMFDFCGMGTRAEALRELQRWFAPLVLAVNCATSVAELQEARSLMADLLAEINREAQKAENSR